MPKIITTLKQAINPDDTLDTEALEKVGLTAILNNSDLTFDVTVPLDLQKPKELSLLINRRPQIEAQSLPKPARVSGYLNLRTGLEYQDTSHRKPIRAQLDGALNILGVVLENQFTYSEAAVRQWTRDHTRLVKDDTKRLWRYTLGDVSYPTLGFQSALPIAGLSLTKEFQLDPYLNFHARGEKSFILTTESEVEIFSNGFSIRKLNLSPGEYHLKDLQLSEGANDTRLQITDSFGKVKEINFTLFYDNQLLQPGVTRFSYSLGFPTTFSGGQRRYETNNLIFSSFYQRGLTPSVTMGINAQAHRSGWQLGISGIFPTRLGNFSPEVAASGQGCAASLQYKLASGGGRTNWSLSTEYRSPDFTVLSLQDADRQNTLAYKLSTQIRTMFANGFSASLNGDYEARRQEKEHYTANLKLSKSFRYFSISTQFRYRHDPQGEELDKALFITINVPLPRIAKQCHQALSGRYNGQDDSFNLGYRLSPRSSIGSGSFSGQLDLDYRSNNKKVTGKLKYRAQRFETNLSHNLAYRNGQSDQQTQRTMLSFNTALAYAEGTFALSRPINNSFALFKTGDTLDDHPPIAIVTPGSLNFDQSEEELPARYLGVIDWLGAGVVAELTPYSYRSFSVDASALPLGMKIIEGDVTFLPSHRSGFLVDIGGEMGVIVDGVLLAKDGKPLSLEGGQMTSLDKPDREATPFFTNRTGRFRIMSSPPGRYQLEIFNYPDALIDIVIPEGHSEDIYNIGEKRLDVLLKAVNTPPP